MMSLFRRRLTGLLVAAAVLLPIPVATADEQRIVGGQIASRPYPHQALLEVKMASGDVGVCGGSLVAARFIVTAAHCLSIDDSPATAIAVTLGNATLSNPPQRNFTGVEWTAHPSYGSDPDGGYDIAIVRLDRAADLEQLRVLRGADTAMWAPGTTATVIGWGLTEDTAEGGQSSAQLREVQVPVFSDPGCTSDFQAARANGFFTPLTMVCAGGKDGRDSCNGDSGGPLLVPDGARFALAGVVSFGAAFKDASGNVYSCAEGLPGVYSRVAADPLNGWVRSRIPQVEIDAAPSQPEPGQQVALTAVGSVAYDSYEWDLDNNGAFGDATGTTASFTPAAGVRTVAVRATRGSGPQRDQEVRRIDIEARYRSPVAFAAPAVAVNEGDPVTVTVNKTGGGAGAFTVTPSGGTATIASVDAAISSPLNLGFTGGQLTQTFTIPTVEDRLTEPAETFTLDIGGHTGELVPGAPGTLTVTIIDDDVVPKIAALSRSTIKRKPGGRVTLKYTINTPGTVRLGITDSRGRVTFASARKTHAIAGTYTATLRLRKPAISRLRKARTLKARAIYSIVEGSDLLDSRIRPLTLKR